MESWHTQGTHNHLYITTLASGRESYISNRFLLGLYRRRTSCSSRGWWMWWQGEGVRGGKVYGGSEARNLVWSSWKGSWNSVNSWNPGKPKCEDGVPSSLSLDMWVWIAITSTVYHCYTNVYHCHIPGFIITTLKLIVARGEFARPTMTRVYIHSRPLLWSFYCHINVCNSQINVYILVIWTFIIDKPTRNIFTVD